MNKETRQPTILKERQQGYLLLGVAFLLLAAGILSGKLLRNESYAVREARKFENTIHQKEQLLKRELRSLEEAFTGESPAEVLQRKSSGYQKLSVKKGISIFYYDREILKYWSDHTVPLPTRWRPRFVRPFLSLRNTDYVTVVRQVDHGKLLGLIEIKTHYPFQNEFLINGYQRDFTLDEGVEIEILEANGSASIYNEDGVYLFSLNFGDEVREDKGIRTLSLVCLVLFLLLAVGGLFRVVKGSSGKIRWIWISITSLFIAGCAVSVLKFSVFSQLNELDLFQPELFASKLFPSLGALLVISMASLVLAILWHLHIIGPGHIHPRRRRELLAVILFMGASILLLAVEHMISILVLDSNISFEAHRVTTFTGYTVIGLLIIIIWFVMLGLVLDKAILLLAGSPSRTLFFGSLAASITIPGAALLPGQDASWICWITMIVLIASHIYLRHQQNGRIPFSRFIFLLLVVSVFMVIRLQQDNRINLEQQKEVELVKLSSEHDPVAEMLFSEMSMAIRNDTIFAQYLNQPFIPIEQVASRLERNYFSGYWTKYDLQITVCRPADSVFIEPDNEWFSNCYDFFDAMIMESGIEIPGSDFYFLDNLNGRISYLASIPYYRSEHEHRVFIELDSKIISEELGYPELLLDDTYTSFTSTDYSYAKYNKGELITKNGEFPYRRSSAYYTGGKEMFEKITLDKYDHSIYNVDENNTIIVGSPSVTLIDNLISFSYIFALNFLLLSLAFLFSLLKPFKPTLNWTFKNRIQYSMGGILFLTFVMICSGTVFFIVQQYRMKNNDNLRNTMRSVYIELIHKVEYEEDLMNWSSDDYYNLDELLRKFSNVFYTDINLYDETGFLLATSRSEIFDRQLLSRRMDRMVYESLAGGDASEIIHHEHIGELQYISVYVPLMNRDNKFLAYLNLPYFTQSEALTRDVTNLVVAVINIYMILLLVILLLSVLLADRISQPLRMIQNRIAQVSLSKKNEMIQYDRSDEIKGLVEEYNYMVQELERSAGLLAQSERESAWREMAKQIAHEIKNPLTPMKLNVQHLQRAIEKGLEDPQMIERISATLIEQIDSLSAIANEFSDFAKMPRARNTNVNLVTQLQNLLQLFENTDKAEIDLNLGDHRKVMVYVDKEQLMRVFINLVKNGLQSIPEGRAGRIGIRLEAEDERTVRVTFSDNGKGIPEEIKDKLFQPNFTTKSAGMGMGLAISYNIIKSLGGRIWYDTVLNKGTTFYVELPQSAEKS